MGLWVWQRCTGRREKGTSEVSINSGSRGSTYSKNKEDGVQEGAQSAGVPGAVHKSPSLGLKHPCENLSGVMQCCNYHAGSEIEPWPGKCRFSERLSQKREGEGEKKEKIR